MPTLTATYTAAVSESTREDLSDIITVIDPTETPIQANLAQIDISNPDGFEWTTDSLNTPTDAGVEDGFDFTDTVPPDGVTTRARYLARCQIQAKGIKISNRQELNDKAGLDSEISHQLAMRADDLKRDCEQAITSFRTPVAAAAGTPPLVAGIPTWIRTNATVASTGGAAPTISGREPVVGTTGTLEAATEDEILDLIGSAWDEGGNIDMISVARAVKQNLSKFFFSSSARIATQYQDQGRSPGSGLQVVGAVDYYVSDFGVHAIVPNRFQNLTSDMLMLDTSLWEIGVFRGFEVQEMGVEGDNQRFVILHDFTLIARDEAGSAIRAGIDPTAAFTAS